MTFHKQWVRGTGPWAGVKGSAHPTFKHGHALTADGRPATKTYNVWSAMMRRCYTPSNPMYARYGGRGIRVCARWANFTNFLADMGEKPFGRSLDRYPNNDGDYEPGNCRWATNIEQARNTSMTMWATLNGERLPVAEWCERLGLNRSTILKRVGRSGWSIERALTTPVVPR